MANGRNDTAVLAADFVDFAFGTDGLGELEPVHFTTSGYGLLDPPGCCGGLWFRPVRAAG